MCLRPLWRHIYTTRAPHIHNLSRTELIVKVLKGLANYYKRGGGGGSANMQNWGRNQRMRCRRTWPLHGHAYVRRTRLLALQMAALVGRSTCVAL